MRRVLFLFISLSLVTGVSAQNENDALMFSREEVTGSARFVSLGGAYTALGGDLSGVYLNPAGIAVYKNQEFSFSGALQNTSSQTDYYGSSSLESKNNFNIPTVGLVGVKDLTRAGQWKSVNFGLGFHRTYNYHQSVMANTNVAPSSLLDAYQVKLEDNDVPWYELAANNPAYPYDVFLAWNNYLIDTLIGANGYYNASGVNLVNQTVEIDRTGSKRETFFSLGGNYNDRLYIGGNLISSRIVYTSSMTHSEIIDSKDTSTVLNEFVYNLTEDVSGRGLSGNIGVIYRPFQFLRVGATIKSPTFYDMEIEYDANNKAIFADTILNETQAPEIGYYEYKIRSPWQSSFGAAFLFGKYGLITSDVEMIYYPAIQMMAITDNYNFASENDALSNLLTPSFNIKVGGEYRFTPQVTGRIGFAHFGSPYKPSLKKDGSFMLYSIGGGYRNDQFFIDGAYQLKTSSESNYAYDASLIDSYNSTLVNHRLTLTFGYKF